MKNFKRIASLVLALTMILCMGVTAFAASITISGTTAVPVTGKDFNAYQILIAQVITASDDTKSILYTVPEALDDFYAEKFDLDKTAGNFDYEVAKKIEETYTTDSSALFAFAKEAIAAAKAANTTSAGSVYVKSVENVNGTTAILDVQNNLGYYVIEDATTTTTEGEPISALMVKSVTENVPVTIKADQPPLDKNIDGTKDTDTSTNEVVKYNNTSFGDTVPFVVTSKVPDMNGYDKYFFVVNDTLSKGLDLDEDSIAIKIGTTTVEKCNHTAVNGVVAHNTPCYTATVSGSASDEAGTSLKIVFNNFIQYKDDPETDAIEGLEGQGINITYDATVTTDAAVGVTGNSNKVTLTYSNNPNVTPKGDNEPGDEDKDVVGTTPEVETRTYVTEVEIKKVDPAGEILPGAVFKISGTRMNTVVVTGFNFVKIADKEPTEGVTLYWELNDGSYTTTDPTTEGLSQEAIAKYVDTSVTYKRVELAETETKPENGTYTITAEVGTNGILKFTGLAAGEYTITEIVAPNGYNLLEGDITLTIACSNVPGNSTDCTWTYTWGTSNQADSNKVTASTTNNNQIVVENTTGATLPSTGGIGTTIFYIVGGVLLVGAAVLLITKRRMNING